MSQPGSVAKGFLLVCALHVAFVVVTLAFATWFPIAVGGILLLAIGLTQLAYVVPLLVWASRRHESRTTKGIVIAAGLTLLLNGACFGFFTMGGVRIGG